MVHVLKNILPWLLNLVFPKNEVVKTLENMSPEELMAAAPLAPRPSSHPNTMHSQNLTISIFSYKHRLVKQMIWELKYKGNKKISRLIAGVIHSHLERIFSVPTNTPIVIIPMPISQKRMVERGYNQCELLVNDLKEILMHKNSNTFVINTFALCKVKDTPRQTTKNRKERLLNIKDCFTAHDSIIGKRIVLIDDVLTTGTTLNEAAATLFKAGAKSVLKITVAR